MSLVLQGVFLERAIGFRKFFSMTMTFILACGFGIVGVHYLLYLFYDGEYYLAKVVGFSSVLYAYKIVMKQSGLDVFSNPNVQSGLTFSAVFEFILMHFVNPYSSFIGHLLGIAVGWEYCHGIPGLGFSITKTVTELIETIVGLAIQMSGFEEEINNAAEGYNERAEDADEAHRMRQNRQQGMFGMGNGFGMGFGGLGGMGGGYYGRTPFGGARYRRW